MGKEKVRVADTETLRALNASSVSAGHIYVLSEQIVESMDPAGLHVCWGTFPHEHETVMTRANSPNDDRWPEEMALSAGVPGGPPSWPHLRTAWLVAVGDGLPVEGILHLDYDQIAELPEYERPGDSNYPPRAE